MKTRLLSVLLIFLLVASVSVPAVSAEPSHVYYELHNMCLCNANEDLGQIYGSWGIGYEAWIDKQTDNWKVFIHAGLATKEFTITPETDLGKLVMLRDFVNNVNECKEESDPIPFNVIVALGSASAGTLSLLKGATTDDAVLTTAGLAGLGYSVEQLSEFARHFENAKNAQKNAEKLFGEL